MKDTDSQDNGIQLRQQHKVNKNKNWIKHLRTYPRRPDWLHADQCHAHSPPPSNMAVNHGRRHRWYAMSPNSNLPVYLGQFHQHDNVLYSFWTGGGREELQILLSELAGSTWKYRFSYGKMQNHQREIIVLYRNWRQLPSATSPIPTPHVVAVDQHTRLGLIMLHRLYELIPIVMRYVILAVHLIQQTKWNNKLGISYSV